MADPKTTTCSSFVGRPGRAVWVLFDAGRFSAHHNVLLHSRTEKRRLGRFIGKNSWDVRDCLLVLLRFTRRPGRLCAFLYWNEGSLYAYLFILGEVPSTTDPLACLALPTTDLLLTCRQTCVNW